jgi:hypothetical protein
MSPLTHGEGYIFGNGDDFGDARGGGNLEVSISSSGEARSLTFGIGKDTQSLTMGGCYMVSL